MKKAKFALTAVAILAVIGGALAFKANRQFKTFYSLGVTEINGVEYPGCVVPVALQKATAAVGQVTPYLTSSTTATTVCETRVVDND